VAEQHRSVAVHAQLVSRFVDVQPAVGIHFIGQICSRISGSKISAPPPGIESSPALFKRAMPLPRSFLPYGTCNQVRQP
jgi:hypothetical protein